MAAFSEFPLPYGVEPVPGELLRYHVQSWSRPSIRHLVDLQECGFNGACSCEAFQMRHLPAMREDRRSGAKPVKRRCRHIDMALRYHAELTCRIIARQMEGKRKKVA